MNQRTIFGVAIWGLFLMGTLSQNSLAATDQSFDAQKPDAVEIVPGVIPLDLINSFRVIAVNEFYKKHPWLYLERMFKDVPSACEIKPKVNNKFFWVPFCLCLFVGLLTRGSHCNTDQIINHLLSFVTAGLISGGIMWIIADFVTYVFTLSPDKNFNIALSEELNSLFKCYSLSTSKILPSKDLIPQELQPIFDEMHKFYLINRTAFFVESSMLLTAIKQLIDKRVQGIKDV